MRANADTPEDAARARRFGAEGIGLCRTEHMFLGERRQLVENLIVADDEAGQEAALGELLPLQRADFIAILEAMDGLPVTIRLIDPPLHEFLPDLTDLSVAGGARGRPRQPRTPATTSCSRRSKRLHEQNPMLGLRGVRLGIVIPGLFTMQARAILEAAADRIDAGGDPQPEIMIPLVGHGQELDLVRAEIDEGRRRGQGRTRRRRSPYKVGTMIELPRAAVTADQIAASAEFFSFGTNDLTQMTWGFSRDDVEASFFAAYLEHGIFPASPFESLDTEGVGCWCATPSGWAGVPGPTCTSASAVSTAATRPRSTSSTRSGSTTSPARPSGCRWRGSRPAVRRSATPDRSEQRDASACRGEHPASALPTAAKRASRCSARGCGRRRRFGGRHRPGG